MTKKRQHKKQDNAISVETLEAMPKSIRENKGTANSTLNKPLTKAEEKELQRVAREENDLLDEMRVDKFTALVPVVEIDTLGVPHLEKEGSNTKYIEQEISYDSFVDTAEQVGKVKIQHADMGELLKVQTEQFAPHIMGLYALAYNLEDRDSLVTYDGKETYKGVAQFDIAVLRLKTCVSLRNKEIVKSEEYNKGERTIIKIPSVFDTMRSTAKGAMTQVCEGRVDKDGVTADPEVFPTYNALRKQKDKLVHQDEEGNPITLQESCKQLRESIKQYKATCNTQENKVLKATKQIDLDKIETGVINAVNDLTAKIMQDNQALTVACNLELAGNMQVREEAKGKGSPDRKTIDVDLPSGKQVTGS